MELNYIAAPILQQRGMQLAHLETWFDQAEMQTVYTVETACGKIGSFRMSPREVHNAFMANGADELIAKHFKEMEFSDGQPAVPEVQPESTDPEADAGQPEPDQETIDILSTTGTSSVDAGGPPAQTKPAWKEQES